MAERYKLPDGVLGGGEIEATEFWSGCAGAQAEYELADGYKIVLPCGERLTPVKPPTPEEPEPGPYWVGDYYVVHAMTNRDKRWGIVGYPSIDWVDWPELLDFVGPDVTITRLVAERVETVTLPWEGKSQTGAFAFRVNRCTGGRAANVSIDNLTASITRPVAREMGAALIAFADSAEDES